MKIAVDAMGGDNAPRLVVQGAVRASEELPAMDIILVGDRKAISDELKGAGERKGIKIHHCEEVVFMDESPMKAVNRKKDSSIQVAFNLLRDGIADAVVSAGNSGATIASGILTLGKMPGVERPAIACILPADKGPVILIDVGGNVDCRPIHILQFAIMAEAFASAYLGLHVPKVGLLSIGQEAGKGNELVRVSHDLLRNSSLNFAGNIEGRDIFAGNIDIVVCDGFVGNIALKLSEGMAETITSRLKTDMMETFLGRLMVLTGNRFLRRFKEKLDYAEYGGAPVLGINGVGIVCHGSSSSKAIKNAIKMAGYFVENGIQEKLIQKIVHDSG